MKARNHTAWIVGFLVVFGIVSLFLDEHGSSRRQEAPIASMSQSATDHVRPKPKKPESTKKSGQQCHPSYSGCLRPDASDYDCAGGSGNGPYYTRRVRVIGPDVFDLDRDGNGWGCD
jgi:hypothetical protein